MIGSRLHSQPISSHLKNKLKYCLYLAIFLFTTITAHAQVQVKQDSEIPAPTQTPLHFEHLGVADGLNQGSVYAIYQDSRGFMWFGTQSGLNRYDGYNVKTYSTDPFDSTSYQGTRAQVIEEDEDGNLWIGSSQRGLSRFDPATGRFKRYAHSLNDTTKVTSGFIVDILEGRSGDIWISALSGGLTRLNPETGSYKRYFHDPEDPASLSTNSPTSMYQDHSGTLWICSFNGLNEFDPQTGDVTRHLYDPKAQVANSVNELSQNNTLFITPDPNDQNILWITGKGLIRFNKQTGEHSRFLPSPYGSDAPAPNALFSIEPDSRRSNIFWITTMRSGLLRFNSQSEQFTRYLHDPDNPNSLNGNNLFSIYTDRTGMIWTGTNDAKGVNRFDPHAGGMEHYGNNLSWSIWQGRRGILWIGSGSKGLSRINRNTGSITRYRHDPDDSSSLSANMVTEIYEDNTGSLWVGTQNGLDKMNRTAGTFTHYQYDQQDSASITSGSVWTILEDRNGVLWVGTGGGVNRMDREAGKFTRFTHDPNDSTSLSDQLIYDLFEDQAGNIWVGTGNGLDRLNRTKSQFRQYSYDPKNPRGISSGSVMSIHERKSEPGVLWIGLGSGLDRLETQTGTFTHYTKEDGLPDNTIYGILEDNDGRLWLSTNRGLSQFDPKTETFKNYGLESGLQALEFNATSYYQASDGEMFFGGINGVNAFYPERLLGNPTPPQVALTGFNLFNKSIKPGPKSPIQAPLSKSEEIRLAHHQNTIAFEYVGLHYRNPEENRYRYMLEGLDEDWVDAGPRRIARYTNLDPGNYTFKVKAANSDGVWSKETASIKVSILPPWWQTWWAYIIYIFILLAGIFAVDRIQRRRLIKKERERAREKELQQEKEHARELEEAYEELENTHENLKAAQEQLVQQEKLASLGQLTAGIAHEIKNPLNFVNNFSDLSVDLVEEAREELSAISDQPREESGHGAGAIAEVLDILDDVEANLKKINEHGNRADGIVKSMLQHSRGGDGKMESTNLNSLVEEYVNLAFHGMRASEQPINVDIKLDLDDEIGTVPMVAEDFSRVIINLCGNAFDAMRNKMDFESGIQDSEEYQPELTIRTYQDDGNVTIEIEDNGPGIPEDVKDKVLQPFFTTKEGKEGTGLGLSITNDIVKAHGGEIKIISNSRGSGTTFQIKIDA